jgi:ABC-type uncharacterized transport system auxiliary subunit
MKAKPQSTYGVASALLLVAVLAGCSLPPSAPLTDLPQRVETARSRSDHQALIAYYKAQAVTARAQVAEHRRLAKSYQEAPSERNGTAMTAHCISIASMYESIAREYEGMAQFHQLLESEPALTKP